MALSDEQTETDLNALRELADKLIKNLALRNHQLDIAVKAHLKNANQDYRGNREEASVRSFQVLEEIKSLEEGIKK